ncbi:hypothetical protein CALCODRAFT_272281 [Calocera cornea HHB12733]|uniref:Uncharacterized protein n=1 Tax=Calocera cornea HHB12733 TaxID=1353952 RepID=A0A165G655_9BASI|nr:hypothetical protein CALCODRAFT_272281 [Calocera cornea HHB12733]
MRSREGGRDGMLWIRVCFQERGTGRSLEAGAEGDRVVFLQEPFVMSLDTFKMTAAKEETAQTQSCLSASAYLASRESVPQVLHKHFHKHPHEALRLRDKLHRLSSPLQHHQSHQVRPAVHTGTPSTPYPG